MLSKSCENSIVCWKPGTLDQSEREKEQRTTIIHKLDVSVVIMVMFRLVQVLKETVGTDGTLTKDWSIFYLKFCKIVSSFYPRSETAKSGLLDSPLIWRRKPWHLAIPRARYTHGTSRCFA